MFMVQGFGPVGLGHLGLDVALDESLFCCPGVHIISEKQVFLVPSSPVDADELQEW